MNSSISDIAKTILKDNTLARSSAAELEQLVNRYPFFIPGRLLYLKKLHEEQHAAFAQEMAAAELWIPNTVWLDHLFTGNGFAKIDEMKQPVKPATPSEPVYYKEEDEPEDTRRQYAGLTGAALADRAEDAAVDITTPDHTTGEQEQTAIETERTKTKTPENVHSEGTDVDPVETTNETKPVNEGDDELVSEPEVFNEAEVAEAVDQAEPVQDGDGEQGFEPEVFNEVELTKTTNETGLAHDNHAEASSEPAFNLPTLKMDPTVSTGEEMLFEPYHTVDYFASQGIRAKEEEKPADRFSQQLKSFTQWLKTMKKIPATAGTAVMPEEKKIEEMAEHSIKGRDVVTEAMAEVWVKQGNIARAIDVYQKLSLLDPSKSSYFAAKIDHLKHS